MAEESELIGGIGVEIDGSDAKLEAALNAAEAKIRAWVAKVEATGQISLGVNLPNTAGGGAPARQQQTPIRFAAAATGGAKGSEQSAFERAVNAELSKQGQVMVDGVVTSINTAQRQTQQRVTRAVGSMEQGTAEPIPVTIDTSEVRSALTELTAELRQFRELASAPIQIQAAPATPTTGGAGRSRRARSTAQAGDEEGEKEQRRKPIRDRSVPVGEPRSDLIYTFDAEEYAREDQIRGAKSRREQEIVARQRAETGRREQERFVRGVNRQLPSMGGGRIPSSIGGSNVRDTANRAPEMSTSSTLTPHNAPPLLPTRWWKSEAKPSDYDDPVEKKKREQEAKREATARARRAASGAREEAAEIESDTKRAERTELRLQKAGINRIFKEAEIQRSYEQQRSTAEANITAAGRTSRTQASSIGGLFGGPRRAQIEAQAALTSSRSNLRSVQSQRSAYTDEIIKRENAANFASPTRAKQLREEASAIRERPDYRKVLDDEAEATEKVAKAQAKLESFSKGASGLITSARSLIAVTAAGAAFGLGLKSIEVVWGAVEKAAAPYIDRLTGYAQKTADLTGVLADQTRAQHGNVEAVVAMRLAQSGFAADSAKSIQPLIQQRAQVEAGNKALVEQIETLRIADNLRKAGANAGVTGGGTGGVLGTSLFGIPSTGEQLGNYLKGLNDQAKGEALGGTSGNPLTYKPKDLFSIGGAYATDASAPTPDATTSAIKGGIDFLNSQLEKGGNGVVKFSKAVTAEEMALSKQTAKAFEGLSPEMVDAINELRLFSTGIRDADDAIRALKAVNIAGTLPDPELLRAQFNRERPAFLAQLERQQQFQISQQIPAQTALANLAQPPTPVGTGIVAANAGEQAKITAETAKTQRLQDSLNAYYEKGRQILTDTYKIPGQLAGEIQSVGQDIAGIQASISNKQAAYQTAQYNYQLFIARRTLSDISGLTGRNFGVSASQLGVLERQNLLLGRQAQSLQFMLSQRQINLQTAVAGFTVPGLTPAEQNARVEEAKIEASYAQKQLDIQKQMFGNQVKIVDISNLRQGVDLVKQIGLLEQGRSITIDTQLAQQELERLQKVQSILVEEAGTYLTKVNAQVSQAMTEMHSLEVATGRAISRVEVQGVAAAYSVGHAFFLGISGGFLGSDAGGGGGGGKKRAASGGVWTASSPNSVTFGEAGTETVAVLRSPRTVSGAALMGSGSGGGGDSTVNFWGDITVRTQADIEEIARKVTAAQGRTASLKGLRTPN